MKKAKLIGGICLVLILAVSLCAVPVLADEPENESGPLPPSIMPVIILQGSDYEMGCQYGQQAGQYIEMQKDAVWASALKKFSYDEVLYELKAGQYYIKEYAPEQIEMMKGIADGATAAGYPMSYIDVLLITSELRRPYPTYTYPEGAEEQELPPTGCSVWSAWGSTTTDESLICGDSCDTTFDYTVAIIAFPDDGNSFISVVLGSGKLSRHFAMNNKGVFIGWSMGFARRAIDYDYGIPYPCATQHLVRFADSAEQAKNMLLPWKLGDLSARNWHFSDVSGDAYVVETTAAVKSVRQPGDFGETDFIYSTNNFFNDEMEAASRGGWEYTEFIEHGGWIGGADSAVARNLELWDMFHNYDGEIDLDFAKMMWRHPGIPPDGTGDGLNNLKPINQLRYWGQICNTDSVHVSIVLPDDGDKGVAYICTGPAGKVNYPLGGDRNFQIAGTHSFYELALASSPSRVVSAAKKAAKCSWSPTMEGGAIGNAYYELMWLNYDDPAYAPLNELFSLANAEYFEGINWANKASSASGDEQLLYYAKAVTAYARAQAHANQVYNALVEPATNPEDLGLKVYGGPWGEWAQPSWSFDLPGERKAKGKDKD